MIKMIIMILMMKQKKKNEEMKINNENVENDLDQVKDVINFI